MSIEKIVEFLTSVDFFSALRPAELQALATQAKTCNYGFGDNIFNAGDSGDGLFVIREGAVRIFTEEHGKEISMGVRKAGQVFGEIAALRKHRHESSVRASAKTELLFIPRIVFAPLLERNKAAQGFVAKYVAISSAGGLVTRLFHLHKNVTPSELEEIIQNVGVKRVKAGTVILEQGGKSDRRLYVVRQGDVRVVSKVDDVEYRTATLQQGEVFGEKACLLHQEQPASVIAKTDTILLVIPDKTVHLILQRNPKLKEVLQERIRFAERELERQKQVAERRKPSVRLLDLHSTPRHGERVIRRFPLVQQAEEMDCGAACLAMICKHFGIGMTLGKLREMANVTTEGATLDSLAQVGESLGFTTRGVKCTFQSLLGFELPFIVHWEGYHFVVVYGISKQHVWVADPALGFRKLTLDDFERGWSGTCLVFTPGSDMADAAPTRSPWVRFVSYLKPYKKILGHLFLATFIIQALGIAPAVIIQNILDRVVVHQNVSLLHLLIAGLIITHVFVQLTSVLRAYLSNFMVRNLDFSMMSQFCKHTFSLPMSFFSKRRTGDIFARFQENMTIRTFLTESTISTVLNLLMVFIYLSILFLYNVRMTLLLIAFVIPILLLTILVTPRLKAYARETFQSATDAEAVLMETLAGAETIKGMGIERTMRMKWEKKYAKSLDVQYRAQRFNILVGASGQLLNAATTVVILWMGASLVLAQELTIGQLIAFNALTGSVLGPLIGLVQMWSQVHEAGVAMERLGDVLDIEPEQKPEELSSRVILPELRGSISLQGVYFRYGANDTPYVLENISVEMKAGELVAIVGQSGSGKTTLAKLLVGFYQATEGRITVDGYDLSAIDMENYRAQIGYVMQSNLLFSGTIAENIAAGDENPERRRILEVARMSDAHGFINATPLGYETIVGERGIGLSGGQIQRLCIARALYHDPRLLIFDEATSALDTQSENNVLHNMKNILKDRTAVVIAHRLSTIMQADKILVLGNGTLVEAGCHDELVERRGMYYQLMQNQMARAS